MKLKLLTYHLRLAPLLQEWGGLKFKPVVRHRGKSGFIPRLEPVDEQQAVDPAQPAAAPMDDVAEEAPAAASSSSVTPAPVNVYGDVRVDRVFDDSDEEVGNVPGGSGRPDTSSADPESERQPLLSDKSSKVSSAPPGAEPDSKRQRTDGDLDLLYSCFMEAEMCYMLTVDLDIASQRQKHAFVSKPILFLAQKLRDCEVRLVKLRPEHRVLFDRAKTKEVNSFISNAAARRCHDLAEEEEAKSSGRLMRCN